MTAAEIHFTFAEGLPQTRSALRYARARLGDQQRDGDRATFSPRDRAAVKLQRYEASFQMLAEEGSDRHLVELLRFELESLQQLSPHPHG